MFKKGWLIINCSIADIKPRTSMISTMTTRTVLNAIVAVVVKVTQMNMRKRCTDSWWVTTGKLMSTCEYGNSACESANSAY